MEPPRLILLRGGRGAEKLAAEKPVGTEEPKIIYRADYSSWWRLPPPLPPRRLPIVRLIVVASVTLTAVISVGE